VHQPDIFGEILQDWDIAILDGTHQACQQHQLGLNSFNAFLHILVIRLQLLKEGRFLLFDLLLPGRSGDRYGGLAATDLVRELLDPVINGSQLKPIEGLFVLLREIGKSFAPRCI
jgi:hypothetical protein